MNSYVAYALADLYLLVALFFTYRIMRAQYRTIKEHTALGEFNPTVFNVTHLGILCFVRAVLNGLQWPKFFDYMPRKRKPAKRSRKAKAK